MSEQADHTQPSDAHPAQRGTARRDRWAHRRAEPRTLAFLWAVYILAAGAVTLGVTIAHGPWALLDQRVYQHAGRTMLLLVAIGLSILWPMVRLSQAVPLREPARSAACKDLLVLLIPAQAVLWAQAVARSGWGLDVIAAMALALLAFPLLLGGVLALLLRPTPYGRPIRRGEARAFDAHEGPTALVRSLAMACVLAAALLPMLALRTGPGWASALSPLGAVLDLAATPQAPPGRASVGVGRWAALGGELVAAMGVWGVLFALPAHRRDDRPRRRRGGPGARVVARGQHL